jgi:hypothetical protein
MLESILNNSRLDVRSELLTLEKLSSRGLCFNTPLYQRLYVWGQDQIQTLLEDIKVAAKAQDPHYYVGTIIIRENQGHISPPRYDLIDGQQRFTTFWLIAWYLKGSLQPFLEASFAGTNHSRLNFEIRDDANLYFRNPEAYDHFDAGARKELAPVIDAVRVINLFFESEGGKQINKADYAGYLFSSVKMVVTEVPDTLDDNRLFEVLNNRGLQLQHHQILKSYLLRKLADEDKPRYGRLWEACADMNNYIEKNIKEVFSLTWKALLGATEQEQEVQLRPDFFSRVGPGGDQRRQHLSELLFTAGPPADKYDPDDDELKYDSGKVSSVISFPMLLLHTLRLQIKDADPGCPDKAIPPVNEKQLLRIFNLHFGPYLTPEGVTAFLDLLLEIRIRFDRNVVKWIERDNNNVQLIKSLYRSGDALQRREPDANDGFAVLQSMLYHSQEKTTQYWLTPFLQHLRKHDDRNSHYAFLRKLDNALFCGEDDTDLRLRTWHMTGTERKPAYNLSFMEDHSGTGYRSYWFYKMDFILWFCRKDIFAARKLTASTREGWEQYRMTSKNSIEHISPQNPKTTDDDIVYDKTDTKELKKWKQDDFGNLVLLSPGMNSEYSNKHYTVKREEFRKKPRPDSLKSAMIFENPNWSFDLCEAHKKEMLRYFEKYLLENSFE